jgi:hypothetical protein
MSLFTISNIFYSYELTVDTSAGILLEYIYNLFCAGMWIIVS